jgi:hypothetical protein
MAQPTLSRQHTSAKQAERDLMKKRCQYVVFTRSGRMPLALESFEEGQHILAIGVVPTRFPTYEAARSAIRRTSRYAVQHGLDCCTNDHFQIMRMTFEKNNRAPSAGKRRAYKRSTSGSNYENDVF